MCETVMVRYSIAICNQNMADTIENSIRSIAGQVDDQYEIVVVDDGSTDGSLEILENLAEEYPSIRVLEGDNRNLAEARNQSFEEAAGEYVLESLDTDDVYEEGITDFVQIFEQLDEQLDFDFYLKGDSINMAPRDLLLAYPYRSMERAEDLDLWKRLFADDAIIWLDHEPFWEQIKEPNSPLRDQFRVDLQRKISILRSGTTLRSCLRWYIRERSILDPGLYYHTIAFTAAYPLAIYRGIYECPSQFEAYGRLVDGIERETRTIEDLEEAYGVQIDRDALSARGRRLFFDVE